MFQQEEAKPKKGYKLSSMIKNVTMKTSPYLPDDEDKITSAYIQCDPYDDDVGFIRLDFNPANIDISQLKGIVNLNWLTHKLYGFDYLLEHGRVTRIDFAVDVASEKVEDLYYYYEKMQRVEVIRTFRGQTEYIESQTEYIGGKIKATKRIAIYDRLPAIKAHNYKKFYDHLLQIPEPENDIMRVEIRLYPKQKHTLKDFLSMKNPFAPLTVSSPKYGKENDLMWKYFIALARFEGAQASLARLPKQKKQEYIASLKKGTVAWWRPEKIWEQLPTVIKSIINA